MAMRLSIGCETSGYRTRPRSCGSGCCPKPVVVLSDLGSDMHYQIDDADTAEMTVECDGSSPFTSSITLTGGRASGTYVTSGDVCFISVTVTNECGTTTQYWRNYTTPKPCDCIVTAFDTPSLWGRAGTVVTTISGSVAAQPLVIGGSTVCASPSACGDVTGSFVKLCPSSGTRRYLVTSATGCGTYHYYIDMLDLSGFGNWPGTFPGYGSRIFLASGWFQKSSNPYPTLTQVTVGTSLLTLLGVGSFNPRNTRDKNMAYFSAANFAPSNSMLKCYRGTLVGSGGAFGASYDNTSNPSSSDQGHCDFAGLTFASEVID